MMTRDRQAPKIPTVLDRLVAAGLSQERIEQHLTAAEMEVGRPPGVAHGSHLDASPGAQLPAATVGARTLPVARRHRGGSAAESFMVQQK
jgi:hypothetical protein